MRRAINVKGRRSLNLTNRNFLCNNMLNRVVLLCFLEELNITFVNVNINLVNT